MGEEKGEVATEEPVVDEPQMTEKVGNTQLAILPDWAIELVNRWRKHDFSDLRLKFDVGLAINKHYGSPKTRQQRGQRVIKTLALTMGIDPAEISRMRNLAELADNFERFRAKHPEVVSWNDVRLLLAGKPIGEQRTVVQALLTRVKAATADLKKGQVTLNQLQRRELLLELEKLASELESRTSIKLTVVDVHETAAA